MRRLAGLVAVVLAGAGVAVVTLTGHRWATPPAPAAAVRAARPPAPDQPLPYSPPLRGEIPAIGVSARVIPLGLHPDGSVAVPSLATPMLTSWYDGGPAPGQRGAAAVYGHVDSARTGPAAFYRLGDLEPGERVRVARADGRVAVFAVYQIAEYPKDAFPTARVYGPTPGPELRLVTCGGPFDAATGGYLDNVVVFARLVPR